MQVNWFLAAAATLNLLGALWFANTGSPKLAVVWAAYAVATGVLSTMEG